MNLHASPATAAQMRRAQQVLSAGLLAWRDDYDQASLAAIVAAGGPVAAADTIISNRSNKAWIAALGGVGVVWRLSAAAQAAHLGVVPPFAGERTWVAERAGMLSASSNAGLYTVAALLARRKTDPWAAAGVLRRSIGLNRPQAVAAANIALSNDAKQANGRADAAATKSLRHRAAMIAATEVHAATQAAAVDVWQQHFDSDQMLLVWDGGSCDVCAPYDGTTAALEDGFPDGLPPLHPNCMCVCECVSVADGVGTGERRAA